jgi:hypothetical protein
MARRGMKFFADRVFISEKEFYQLSNEFAFLGQRYHSQLLIVAGCLPSDPSGPSGCLPVVDFT